MFSWNYVFHSVGIVLAFPAIVLAKLRGRDVGFEIHSRRVDKWTRIGARYTVKPKKVFGFWMYLNPNDQTPISTSIGTSGFLDLPLTCLLVKVVKKGMNIVDVGANIGYYTLLGAQIVGKQGRVYAFEPDAFNFRLLDRSIRENSALNIETYPIAVSDVSGQVKLFRADPSQPGGHSIGRDRGHGFEEVESTTLDDFWEKNGRPRIDFVKVHVAGDDPLVLAGMGKILKESRPIVAMVFDPPKWKGKETLLNYLFELYQVSEIVESPFLLKKTTLDSLNREHATELFLRRRI